MDIFDKTNYHFLGIGGIGISAIARMLLGEGKKVSGSDVASSEITDELKKLGAKINIGQKAENVPEDMEAAIYTVAVSETNPELKEVMKRKIPCISYPQVLGELSKQKFTIAVAGTHGKTTTTAMIGHILQKAGLDPTIIVGSKMLGQENGQASNFHKGSSKYMVIEACEYKRSFLNLSPKVLVITNIEPDHLDYYKNLDDIKNAFAELRAKVPKEGFVVTEKEYKKIKTDFSLPIPGAHNIKNAQAAIAAVEKLGISQEKSKKFMKDFRGTWRRFEYKGEKDGIVFYDDYAHHPTAICAILSALRDKYSDRKIVAVFEPHQQKRTKDFFDEFVSSLSLADYCFVAPIYAAREVPDPTISNQILAEAVSKNIFASAVENVEQLKVKFGEIIYPSPLSLQEGESRTKLCVAMMGAGDIYKWTTELFLCP